MYTIKTLNAISPVGLAKLPANQFEIDNEAAAPQGILVRSADMHDTPLPDSLLAIARAGAGTNNIPVEDCTNKGIVVFNTPGANANAVAELVVGALVAGSRNLVDAVNWAQTLKGRDTIAKDVEKGKKAFVGPELRGKTLGVIGLGAIGARVANAAVALGMIPGDPHIYARAMFWLPEDVLAAQTTDGNRRERDEAPYLLWERQGLLRSYQGSKVDKHVFLDWFRELRDDDDFYIIYIAYDPWHIDDTLLREFKQEFGERCMIPVRQGSLTLSAPMKELKADLAAGRIVHNNNPVLQMCLTNTEVLADTNGNIKPIKGIDLTQRIDGTIALICAYIALINHYDDLQAVI